MGKKLIREKNMAHIIIAALFSVLLIFGMSGVSSPLQQPQQQEAYASSQAPQSSEIPTAPTPICNPNSATLQSGSTGAKVTELQRVLILVGYGSLLGQSGIDGKFGTSTQNAVKKFQQDNRIPVDGKVGPITWGTLCAIIPNSFIIQLKFTNPSSLREIMGALTRQLAEMGGRVVAVYDQFGMFNVVFQRPLANPEELIQSLRGHEAIQAVFHDTIVTVSQLQIPQRGLSTGIDRVDAELSAARSGDGRGEVNADIAIIDSGVNNRHPDLNVVRCVTLIRLLNLHYDKANECYDGDNHGTGVAGVAAAKDNNIGVVGTAPGARIWAIKVLDNNGRGDESDTLAGLNYVAKNFKQIEVVNLSLRHMGCYSPITYAIDRLVLAGVVVVVAAGNDNVDASSVTPACVPAAITVSAVADTDGMCGGRGQIIDEYSTFIQSQFPFQPEIIRNPDDFIASYSNYGEIVDLAAPAGRTLSTTNVGGYDSIGGTSAAAPHVAGAAALYKSLHPNANPISIDTFLKNSGTKAPPAGNPLLPCNGAGQGYFNDRYGTAGVAGVATDNDKEPLLYMGGIQAPAPAPP